MSRPKNTAKETAPEVAAVDEAKSGETTAADARETETAVNEENTVPAAAGEAKAEEKPAKRSYTKRAARQTEKPELIPEIHLEFQGKDALESDVIAKIKAAFVGEGHRASSIKSLQVYLKPEDSKAYYVINGGKSSGSVDLF